MASTKQGRIAYLLALSLGLAAAGCGAGTQGESNGTSPGAGGGGGAGTTNSGGGKGSVSSGGSAGTTSGATSTESGGGATANGGNAGASSGAGGGERTGGGPGRDASPAGGAGGGSRDGGVLSDGRSAGDATGTGGSGPASSDGGASATGKIFSKCRFHFGTQTNKLTAALLPLLDIYDAGWMTSGNFGWTGVCRDTNTGGRAAGLVPTVFAYVAASIVKGAHQLCDCNVAGCAGGNLCQYGTQYIDQDWATILAAYTSNGNAAACMGTRPYIVRMEPDWYQYIGNSQSVKWTAAQAGTKMTALVQAMGTSRPNALFSMDISPWISDSAAQSWYANFDMSLFTFINTSGGSSAGNIPKIRAGNAMSWAGVFKAAGNKPIIADTGYGAAGAGTGEDTTWNLATDINARMLDGVAALIQPYPGATWGATVAAMQPQLNTPPNCY